MLCHAVMTAFLCSDSENSDDDDDDDDDDEPTLEHIDVPHHGGVNRLRVMPQKQHSGVVATMSSLGQAHVFDLSEQLNSMLRHGPRAPPPARPTFTFTGHRDEGYALDWSPVVAGQLLTGDCAGDIFSWSPLTSSTPSSAQSFQSWQGGATPFRGHTSSVEDLQWSPSEATVFASASADTTVKIWDTRSKTGGAQLTVAAHDDDVNVLSWNHNVNYLLASGCEDGSFKVWDLRMVQRQGGAPLQPLANFHFHRGPISSIEW